MPIILGDLTDPRVTALLEHHVAAARATAPPESCHALDLSGLQAPDIRFWCTWQGETLLGCGALRRLPPEHGRGHGEVKSMHTTSAVRRSGVGTHMLMHIMEAARADGLTRLSLETGAADYFQPAIELYRRFGFVECPPYGDYAPDPHSIFMTLQLPAD